MRGLPYSASEDDIRGFFSPLNPSRVEILRNRENRPSGEAECDFATYDELSEAMKFDKKHIGSRYIELFLVCGSKDDAEGGANNRASYNKVGSMMSQHFGMSSFGGNSRGNNPIGSNMQSMYPSSMPVMPPPPPPPPPQATQQFSAYSTNINEMLMADMAKKMFTAFGQMPPQMYQQQQQQQQQNQQQKYTGMGTMNRRF
jgi:RNA recognition motif-containing protein